MPPATSTSYHLVPAGSGTGTLTLNNSASAVPLLVLGGSDSISAPITLAGNLAVCDSAGTSLAISGNIGQSTTASLALSGDGRLILSGSDSYTGGTAVTGGTLVVESAKGLPSGRRLSVGAGSGTLFGSEMQGAMMEGGTAAPVPEPGTLALALAVIGIAAGYRKIRARR